MFSYAKLTKKGQEVNTANLWTIIKISGNKCSEFYLLWLIAFFLCIFLDYISMDLCNTYITDKRNSFQYTTITKHFLAFQNVGTVHALSNVYIFLLNVHKV